MSRFNTTKTPNVPDTTNRAGGDSFEQEPKLALASLLFTSFVKDQYYRSASEQAEEIAERVSNLNDKRFAAKAAIAARTEFHMRTTSHIVAGEVARQVKGEQWTKEFFHRIVVRPDDMLEIVAYYKEHEGGGLPAAMRKGFNKALRSLDEYRLAKYQRSRHEWSLHDVVNLTHPEPTEAINKMMNGELDAPDTWEARKTQAGQSEDEEAEQVWEELIQEEKLGYFALLRNLRNIAQEAPDVIDAALTQLTDESRIQGSKVLPFRYLTAMDAIQEARLDRRVQQSIMDGLSDALDISVQNVPEFDGSMCVVLDTSASMRGRPMKIGSLFASVLVKSNASDLITFDRKAEYKAPNLSDTTTTIANGLRASGGGTDLSSAFREMDQEYDYIVVLSDMQHWIDNYRATGQEALNEYQSRIGADPLVYSFDLQGYGDMQFPEDKVVEIAGFSDTVFDVMKTVEEGPEALLNEVKQIKLHSA